MLPVFKKTLLLLALGALFGGGLLIAQPALAADPYAVSGVHVDATAASSTEAYNAALDQGRPRAWQILYRRLTQQKDWTRQPELDAVALQRVMRGYDVANERRSTTRYVADVTYNFNPDAVNRLLQSSGIAYTQGAARKILIVPVSSGAQLGPWAQALNAPSLRDSVVPYSVAATADNLGGLNFDSANWNDVAAAARKAGASEAALAQVESAAGKMTVSIRRLGPGEAPAKSSADVPGTSYPSAATAALNMIEDMWKSRAAIDFSQRGRLTVNVRMSSLAQWGAIQTALAGVDNITNVTVNAVDIGYAQISIAYTGSSEQLREVVGAAGLALAPVRGDTAWTLAMNGDPQ